MEKKSKMSCEYRKDKFNYVSECGFRMPYNKFWRFCPSCGKLIVVVNDKAHDEK